MSNRDEILRRICRVEKATAAENGVLWHLKRTANVCRNLGFRLGHALKKLDKGELKLTKAEQTAFIEAARMFNSKVKPALKAVADKTKKK